MHCLCSEGTEICGYVIHVDFVHLEKFDKKLQDMSTRKDNILISKNK